MERVYVENDWYDGPRSGIADFEGKPHRFIANFDDLKGYSDTFKIFPIGKEEFNLEVEQWSIFVAWNQRYEAGETDSDTHPGHGGIDFRYDQIQKALELKRTSIPSNAAIATADFERIDQENRYEVTGPCYGVIWHVQK